MTTRRARSGRRVGAVVGVLALTALLSPILATPAGASVSRLAVVANAGAVTKSKTVERTFLDDGKTTRVDKRNVTLNVSQTEGLHSLQLIHVSWSGAHPTGGIAPDLNSDIAQNEEYPMALFECRGTDTSADPISPDTCWTQYADERFTDGSDDPAYPAWRSDAYAPAGQRAAFVNVPAKLTQQCKNVLTNTTFQRWVPFIGADKTNYAGGFAGCQGQPPEASPANLTGNVALPSNETFGVSDSSGNGSADFDVFTGEDHASLGCSTTVACTLVAVPVMGISCDAAGQDLPAAQRPAAAAVATARANCEQTGTFASGQHLSQQQAGEAAVDGSLWWSASNWRNRISVPLSFAPADNLCSLNSAAVPEDIYGSELMIQATTSWAPHFCQNSKLFEFNHVQTPEPQARSLLQQGNIDAAFTSEPPDTAYPEPTVNAPVALTGFGIAYDIDGTNGSQLPTLNLDARLLAKLLTESYPDQNFVKGTYEGPVPPKATPPKKTPPRSTALRDNPLNITQDPEFQALNPNVPQRFLDSAATLLTVNTDSDVMQALTSYINADPEARAWLDGKPDPWGMQVNPYYKKIALPVNNWPLLDAYEPLDEYAPGRIDCLYANPVPFLPLVAAPTARLADIAQDMEFAIAQSQTTCVLPSPIPGSLAGAKMVASGRQSAGNRAMLGVVSLGDAQRDGLSLASLETSSSVDPSTKITDATGRTFATPSTATMKAAAQTLVPDKMTGTWTVPYSDLRTSKAGVDAYPGTMPVYAAIPTKGLAATVAKDLSEFLAFTADAGQHPGTQAGDLPAGYLPMTEANGLGAEATYTSCAAKAVAAQTGELPSLTGGCPDTSQGSSPGNHGQTTAPVSLPTNPTTTGGSTGGQTNGGGTTGGGTAGGGTGTGAATTAPAGGSTTGSTTSPTGKTSPAGSASTTPGTIAASAVAATTPTVGSGLSGLALPLLFAVAILGGIGALVTRLNSGKRGSR